MKALLREVSLAWRAIVHAPLVSAAVAGTIALGIAATTTLFTVVDRIVLRPLPFPDSDRVVALCETSARTSSLCVASPANVTDWARAVPALDAAGVARSESIIASTIGPSFGVPGGIASPGFFRALGITPELGRLFDDQDLDPARNHVTVVSDGFWRQRLGADPAAIGRTITFDGRPVQVVGVLPAGAYIPTYDFVEAWKPLTASIDDTSNRGWRGFLAIGRRARGATVSELAAQLEVARARLAAAYPESNAQWGVRTIDLRDYVVGPVGTTLWLFFGAAVLVLLIACANVASLLLVRVSARAPEFAVRLSLGAGPFRVARQVLTESLLLATAGGMAGVLLAMAATRWLVSLAPADTPRLDEVSVDGSVTLAAWIMTAIAAAVCAIPPARQASRINLVETMKTARQTGGSGARTRAALVVAELALAVVLLVGAGLLTRAFGRLFDWNPGFDRAGVAVSWLLAPQGTYHTNQAAVAVLERARDEVAAVPGVFAVGLASAGPLFGGTETGALTIEGEPPSDPTRAPTVEWYDADPHYFEAIGRRILRGRGIAAGDVDGAPPVAVVSESFARQFFPGANPIGRRVTTQGHTAAIVGVVSDVRPLQPDRSPAPQVFWPIRQFPRLAAYLVVRTAPRTNVESAAKARITAIDPDLSPTAFRSIDQIFLRTLVNPRFNAVLITAFAIVAMLLAAIGVYGVIAYTVARRTREIGLRIALGATPGRVVAGVLRGSVTLALAGIAAGVVLSLLVGRLLSSLLYGVPPGDPLTLSVSVAGSLALATVAGYLPARRARRVDPLTALRQD